MESPMSGSVVFAQAMLAAITLAYGSAFTGLWLSYRRDVMRAAALAWLGLGTYSALVGLGQLPSQPAAGGVTPWAATLLDYLIAIIGPFTAMAVVGVALAVVAPQRSRRFLGVLAAAVSALMCVAVVLRLDHEAVIRVVVLAALVSALVYAWRAPQVPGRRSIMTAMALFILRPLFSVLSVQAGTPTQSPWYTALQLIVTIAAGFFTTMALFTIEREHALRERLLLEHSLAHAQRMDSLGRMAASVAHDFNNILAAVLAASECAADESSPADERRAAAADVVGAVARGQSLTRGLLTFARPQASTDDFDPFSRLTDVRPLLERLVGKDVQVQWQVDPPSPEVRVAGDASQFEQLLLNLAANARDAMPDGGTLTVRGRLNTANLAGTGEAPVVGPCLELHVIDTGCGMSAETLERVFEPFFTTKDRRGGTGLGLATSFGYVRAARGHMRVSSRLNEGSTFTVLLPVQQATG